MIEGTYYREQKKDYLITKDKIVEITEIIEKAKMKIKLISNCEILIQKDNDDYKVIITKESNDIIFGVLHTSSNISYGSTKSGGIRKKFTPYNNNYPDFIVGTTKKNNSFDMLVSIKFDKWELNNPIGKILDYYGEIGDFKMESIFYEKYATSLWKKNLIIDEKNYLIDLTPDRVDLTDKQIISIDPDGCIDIDDAFHISKINDDEYELGIHIADVSSYIPENSELDLEIKKRCETIYLPKKQINMIPDDLSIKHMSLIKNKKSRAFSLLTIININTGEIKSYKFTKSWIIVKSNYTYDEINKIINSNKYISNIFTIVDKVHRKRENSTVKFSCSLNNENCDSHKLVEVLMIIANSLAAERLYQYYKTNAIVRKHKGYKNKSSDANIKNKLINLYNMERAEYSLAEDDCGHVALGEDKYTHFTSPIRRYFDILVHRMLYKIDKDEYKNEKNENIIKDLYKINQTQKKLNNIYRESFIITKLFKLNKQNIESVEVDGIILGINNTIILIKIDKLELCTELNLLPDKLNHLVEVDNKTPDVLKLKNKETNEQIELTLELNIKLELSITQKTVKKLNCKIIEPEMQYIYNSFDLY